MAFSLVIHSFYHEVASRPDKMMLWWSSYWMFMFKRKSKPLQNTCIFSQNLRNFIIDTILLNGVGHLRNLNGFWYCFTERHRTSKKSNIGNSFIERKQTSTKSNIVFAEDICIPHHSDIVTVVIHKTSKNGLSSRIAMF